MRGILILQDSLINKQPNLTDPLAHSGGYTENITDIDISSGDDLRLFFGSVPPSYRGWADKNLEVTLFSKSLVFPKCLTNFFPIITI